MENYRKDLIREFAQNLPKDYTNILNKYNLSTKDIISYRGLPFFQESILRNQFKHFIRKNKSYFDGAIEYTLKDGKISLNFNILRNPEIKTCNVGSFGAKTGGKYCIATVGELLAQLFGVFDNSQYKYIPENIKRPINDHKNNIFVILSPAMCNNAVNSAAEVYIKLFSQGKKDETFTFLNIPLGPEPKNSLKHGVNITILKDNIGGVAQLG